MAASTHAIEELYRRRYSAFRGGVATLTGSYDSARDVVQDAFAQALRDRRQFRGDGSLESWVWRIAFRTALRSREKATLDGVAEASSPPSSPGHSAHRMAAPAYSAPAPTSTRSSSSSGTTAAT